MLSVINKPTCYSNLSRFSFNLNQHVNRDHRMNLNLNSNLNQINLNQLNLNQRRNLSIDSFAQVAISLNKTFANSIFTDYIQKSLISIHDATGLPWYLEICLASVILRGTSLGFLISERKQSSIYERFFIPEMKTKLEQIRETSKRKLQLRELRSEKQAKVWFNQERNKAKKELYQKYNCHPGRKVITVLSNFPIWLLASFSIGNLCARNLNIIEKQSVMSNILHASPQVSSEGCLWFQNLSLPDPYYILPILLSLSLYTSIEYNILIRRHNYIEDTFILKFLNTSFRVIAIILPIAASVTPSVSYQILQLF